MAKQTWTEDTIRGIAKDLGYWPAKIICHKHDYWYLIKSRSPSEPIFTGKSNKEFINLGALGSPDAVVAVVSLLKAQKEGATNE